MTSQIPESTRDLFERPILCALSTINPDGQPHTVPVWCDLESGHVRVNSPDNTKKARNMNEGSKVTVLIIDPQSPYHWVEVQGHIAEIKDESHGARDHINSLSMKYRGEPVYQSYGNVPQNRQMYVIQPDKVNGQ